MNGRADTFQDHQGDENTYPGSAWVVTVWSATGELLRMGRYPGRSANWPPAQAEKFQGMIRRLVARSLRIIMRPFNPGSNWGTSAMLGDMAAGVFLDDRTVYNQGRNALLRYMPGIIKKEGWCNETAEAGRHQNDLAIYQAKYDGQMDPRIGVARRWYANPLRGIPVGPLHKEAGWRYHAKGGPQHGAFEMASTTTRTSITRPGRRDSRTGAALLYGIRGRISPSS